MLVGGEGRVGRETSLPTAVISCQPMPSSSQRLVNPRVLLEDTVTSPRSRHSSRPDGERHLPRPLGVGRGRDLERDPPAADGDGDAPGHVRALAGRRRRPARCPRAYRCRRCRCAVCAGTWGSRRRPRPRGRRSRSGETSQAVVVVDGRVAERVGERRGGRRQEDSGGTDDHEGSSRPAKGHTGPSAQSRSAVRNRTGWGSETNRLCGSVSGPELHPVPAPVTHRGLMHEETHVPTRRSRARRRAVADALGRGHRRGWDLAARPGTSSASSHREAPFVASGPGYRQHRPLRVHQPGRAESTATLIANWSPFQEPVGWPELLPVGDGCGATTSTSTTTVTPSPTSPTAGRSRTSTTA